jgi:siroheme synthase-like protein
MSAYYPVFLDLKEKSCVIIGGGQVAERKIKALRECRAKVTLVSPKVTQGIEEMAGRDELEWIPREYVEGDLQGVFLAIAATDRQEVNKAIADEADRERVILNVVDNAPLCTFIAPSVLKRGEVTMAISTGGASPALARKLRESLEHSEVLGYASLAGILSSARKEIKRQGIEVHSDRWQECISTDLVALVEAGKSQDALDMLLSMLVGDSQERARASS